MDSHIESAGSHKRQKLARLPDNYRIEKRPLLRPPIASPYAGPSTQKVVYISSKMPFMAAVKRVQKLLELTEKRETQAASAKVQSSKKRKQYGNANAADDLVRVAAVAAEKRLKERADGKTDEGEVVMKATGKAIEKALGLALWFQQRDEYTIDIRTSSVGAIDDIVAIEGEEGAGDDIAAAGDTMRDQSGIDNTLSTMETPESRIRYTSVVEVSVFLR